MNRLIIILVAIIFILLVVLAFKIHAMRAQALALIQAWAQHLLYTRLVVMAFFSDNPELSSLSAKLMQNQADLGQLIGAQFGPATVTAVTTALREHITLAVQVLTAVKEKIDPTAAIAAFYQNAAQIGQTLDKLYGTGSMFQECMRDHITLLIANVQSYRARENDITTLDAYFNEGMKMAVLQARYI